MSYFLIFLITMTSVYASLEKIQIKNLNFTYALPYGSGDVEKVSVGASLKKENYPVEIRRADSSFEISSRFVDFQWLNPPPFVHNISKGKATGLNLKIDQRQHFLNAADLQFTGEKTGEFVFNNLNIVCQGSSLKSVPIERLKIDCLESLQGSISHLELPFEFITSIAAQLPDEPTETEDNIPSNDFAIKIEQGDFFSYLRIKYIVRAYLRFWGHAQFENEGKTLAIRMDEIKYGVLPVTTLVMNELRRQIRNPNVTVTPPWIRIKLGEK